MILCHNQNHSSQGSSEQEPNVVEGASKSILFKSLKEWLKLVWNLSHLDLLSVGVDQDSSEEWVDQEQEKVHADQTGADDLEWCAVELFEISILKAAIDGQNVDDREDEELEVALHEELGGSNTEDASVAVFPGPNT